MIGERKDKMEAIVKNEIAWQKIEDKVFIFNERNGNVVCLEDSGPEFWELLQNETNVAVIVQKMAASYDISKQEIEEDFFELLDELEKMEVIEKRD